MLGSIRQEVILEDTITQKEIHFILYLLGDTVLFNGGMDGMVIDFLISII
jgi:hypothetical protein